MKDWKKWVHKLLFPPAWLILILAVFSAVSLTAVFMRGQNKTVTAHIIYIVSFYALTVLCIFFSIKVPKYYRKTKEKIYDNEFGNRYMTDPAFRTHVSLYRSFSVNLLFAATNLFSGVYYHSVWFNTLAAYYIILAVMRFLLLRFVNHNSIGGEEYVKELKIARVCGVILMALNITLSGVVVLVITQDAGFTYGGILIYAMALYTFYITVAAVVNLVKYRRFHSPVMTVAKVINLAAALVSMLALETAMLSQFGTGDAGPYFKQIMIGLTGAAVSTIVIVMSVGIIVKTSKNLKK